MKHEDTLQSNGNTMFFQIQNSNEALDKTDGQGFPSSGMPGNKTCPLQ